MYIVEDENGEKQITTWFQKPPGALLLTAGGSGGIYYYPDNSTEVIKVPTTIPNSIKNIAIEKRVYERLGQHPNIVPCLRINEAKEGCVEHIVLRRAEHGAIREYFMKGGTATLDERIEWSRDIARAVQHLHDNNVRHGDIGGRNVLLDSSRTVLLCDFAGSGIDGEAPTVQPEAGFQHPDPYENDSATIRSELHALGSTIYEIITSSTPHGKFEGWMVDSIRGFKNKYEGAKDCPEDAVEDWMVELWIRERRYPEVDSVALGDIITKCWEGEFKSAEEVARSIERQMGVA